MAVTPEHHFDLKAAAFSLAEILNKDALSENRFRDEPATSLPRFHGAAAWINTFLYIILKVETPNGTGRNQAVDAPRLNSSLSISRGVAPPRICRGVSLSSFCTHATCSGVTVAKSVPFL